MRQDQLKNKSLVDIVPARAQRSYKAMVSENLKTLRARMGYAESRAAFARFLGIDDATYGRSEERGTFKTELAEALFVKCGEKAASFVLAGSNSTNNDEESARDYLSSLSEENLLEVAMSALQRLASMRESQSVGSTSSQGNGQL